MTTLGVPLDGIIGSQPDPLWQWPVLTLLLGQNALGSEGLLRWLRTSIESDDENSREG